MISRFMGCERLHLRDDGRTIEGCIVPYEEVADVVERDEVTGELVRYREKFLKGSVSRMANAVSARGNGAYVKFLIEHEEALENTIGHMTVLEDRDDGAYATFRLYDSKDLLKVQSMLRESHHGLSVGFADYKPPKVIDDVISRVQVVIKHVAATPMPAYAGASITGMRSDESMMIGTTPELDAVKAMLAELKGATR